MVGVRVWGLWFGFGFRVGGLGLGFGDWGSGLGICALGSRV